MTPTDEELGPLPKPDSYAWRSTGLTSALSPMPRFNTGQFRTAQREAFAKGYAKAASHIDELLVVCCLDTVAEDETFHSALMRLIQWEIQVALDPSVSREAQRLIDRGYTKGIADERARCAKVARGVEGLDDEEAYYGRAIAEAILNTGHADDSRRGIPTTTEPTK